MALKNTRQSLLKSKIRQLDQIQASPPMAIKAIGGLIYLNIIMTYESYQFLSSASPFFLFLFL